MICLMFTQENANLTSTGVDSLQIVLGTVYVQVSATIASVVCVTREESDRSHSDRIVDVNRTNMSSTRLIGPLICGGTPFNPFGHKPP